MPEETIGEQSKDTVLPASKVLPDNWGDHSDCIAAIIVALFLDGGLIWFANTYQEGHYVQSFMLVGIMGSALGWIVGILASPYSADERSSFSDLAKLIYGFLSGYILSKLDPLISHLLTPNSIQSIEGHYAALVPFGVTSFVVAVGVTYVTRCYWTGH